MYRVTYPINDNVRKALKRFPPIAHALQLPDHGRSEREIVRFLDNTHDEGIQRLLEFIDKWLVKSGPIGRTLLKEKHYFPFRQRGAELELFAHLYEHFGDDVVAVEAGSAPVSPDIEVTYGEWTVRLEIYTPVDLMGMQIYDYYVLPMLKYFDIRKGFKLNVELEPASNEFDYDPDDLYYAYTFPNETEMHAWLEVFAKGVAGWLSKPSPEPSYSIEGPGGATKVVVTIVELRDDERSRCVTYRAGTRSSDTSLYFEVGTVQDTAESEWGRKLSRKLHKAQCGPTDPKVLRVLIVNFAMAAAGWPEFISQEQFTKRFQDLIPMLVGKATPYDVVLPAQIGPRCCCGKPVLLDPSKRAHAEHFFAKAELDRPCLPHPGPTQEELDELLEGLQDHE